MKRFTTILLAVLLVVCAMRAASVCYGQPPEQDSTAASPDSGSPDSGVSISVAPGGAQRHVEGKWVTLAVYGTNRTDQDAEETVTVIIGDDTNQQFARRLWIPARATRKSWLQAKIPDRLDLRQAQLEMKSIHLVESESGEQFQSNSVGMTMSERLLLLSREQVRTAVVFDRTESFELTDMVYAGRDAKLLFGQDLGLISLGEDFLPPSTKALDAVDQVVIASDQILTDSVAVTRLRNWLYSGGRMWIMVDQIEPETVRTLIGDVACYSVVDRVELNDFEHEQVSQHLTSFGTDTWSSESPVEFVRVLVDTDDIHAQIDGWPTAFWKRFGHGEVLFTTLSAGGWMQNRKPMPSYKRLSNRFFEPRIEPPQHAEKMIPFLDEEIGYTIPSRTLVAGVLALHVLIVLGAGAWLARCQRLHHLAFVVPVAGLIVAGSLVGIGNQHTSAVPSTIVTGQIARAIPDSSEVQVNSVAAIYSQQRSRLKIESSPETTTVIRDDDSPGEMRRLLWNDQGDSSWLYVTQPPGVVRHFESDSIVVMPQPWSVKGRFSERGFEGQINGLDADRCDDAVIVASAAPALAVNLPQDSQGAFVCGAQDVLWPGQFIGDKLLSDTQQDRQELLRQLHSPESTLYGREPSMLVWTDPIDSGVNFDDHYVRRGSALVSIPIRLQRLASGSKFQVPASFVRLEAEVSRVFNSQTGLWLDEMNQPNESRLRCVLPKTLLPCKLERASVAIKIDAPSRTLEIKCVVNDEDVTLFRKENPTGLLRFQIEQPDALQLDDKGGFPLVISVSQSFEEREAEKGEAEERLADERAIAEWARGESEAARTPQELGEPNVPSRSTWNIDYVHVNVEGTSL